MRFAGPHPVRGRRPSAAAVLCSVVAAGALLLSACTTGSSPAPSRTGTAPTTPAAALTPSAAAPSTPSDTAVMPLPSASDGAPSDATPSTEVAPSGTSAPTRATVIVVHAGWNASLQAVAVRAYAPNVLATKATCTLRLTNDGTTREATRDASRSASDMQCGNLTIPGSQLSDGTWTVQVEFSSPEARGTSSPQTITVTK